MKKVLFAVALAAASAGLTSSASAQVVVDMSLISCDQYLKAPPDRQAMIGAWLSGYWNSSQNRPQLDLAYFKRNIDVAMKACKKSRKETLMSVIQRTAH